MIIDDKTWDAIVTATRAGIDRWNARAAENGVKDSFHCEVHTEKDIVVLLTRHAGGWNNRRKAVVRELATGELRRATPIFKRDRLTSVSVHTSDPKGWQALAGKSASEIARGLKLTDFKIITLTIARPDEPVAKSA
jgi:hypothetical protein